MGRQSGKGKEGREEFAAHGPTRCGGSIMGGEEGPVGRLGGPGWSEHAMVLGARRGAQPGVYAGEVLESSSGRARQFGEEMHHPRGPDI